jgi:hypothetical protein
VARYVAFCLVLVLTVASARTLVCEWVCEASGPEQASESCQHGSGAVAESQLTGAHPCDVNVVAITLAGVKTLIAGRFAIIASDVATPLQLDRMRLANGQFRMSAPDALPGSRARATSVLRI